LRGFIRKFNIRRKIKTVFNGRIVGERI
jgi:hypothetical protein